MDKKPNFVESRTSRKSKKRAWFNTYQHDLIVEMLKVGINMNQISKFTHLNLSRKIISNIKKVLINNK